MMANGRTIHLIETFQRRWKLMRRVVGIIICLPLVVGGLLTAPVFAQESAQQRAANLRAQLAETQARQTELETRREQLADDLKPENIERALAGIGSTHPEDLREQRRRQLETEKKGVESQLETLAASRARLESAIASADAISYRSAGLGGPGISQSENNAPAVTKQRANRVSKRKTKKHRTLKRS
jgi:septal ring factor EnvC (AmiA/AmiB activator)